MNLLSKNDLLNVVDHPEGPCVSLYLPTHRAGAETQQDPIRLKNLLRRAESDLGENGHGATEISRLLQPARALLEDYDFWQHQDEGLAILRSPELFRLYRLPSPVPELVVTADHFHVKPLLAWSAATAQYYILALSQDHARVFLAARDGLVELENADLPNRLRHNMRNRMPERRLQSHTVAAVPVGGGGVMFHGQGGGREDRKEMTLTYFQRLDEGIQDLLARNRLPVVLAAVDYVQAIYRQANSIPGLLDDGVSGNPDNMTPQELHGKADEIVSAYFTKDQQKAADQYLRLWFTGRASNTLADILPAAYQGRIQSLFVALGVQQWGRFDESRGETVISENLTPLDQDLLNLAAIQTLVTGGSVYPVAPAEVPSGSNVAAVFRY